MDCSCAFLGIGGTTVSGQEHNYEESVRQRHYLRYKLRGANKSVQFFGTDTRSEGPIRIPSVELTSEKKLSFQPAYGEVRLR